MADLCLTHGFSLYAHDLDMKIHWLRDNDILIVLASAQIVCS
jgi:hypothetical protein